MLHTTVFGTDDVLSPLNSVHNQLAELFLLFRPYNLQHSQIIFSKISVCSTQPIINISHKNKITLAKYHQK